MAGSKSSSNTSAARRGSAPGAARPVIFGTGLIALDVVISADPTREPVLAAGGTCGNVLTALSYLGWAAYPVARLNGDPASALVRDDLSRWDVALDFAALTPNAATPIIVQRIRRDERGRATHRYSLKCPVCRRWFPSFRPVTRKAAHEVIAAATARKPADFEPSVFFFDRVSRGALLLAEAFAARGALIVFEPSAVSDPRLFAEALAVAHVLKYSRQRLPDLAASRPARLTPLLEIETWAETGLRYRSSLLRTRAWRRLEAIRGPEVADTAGAGDWCTAGLIFRLAAAGLEHPKALPPSDLEEGIRFGQAVAAMACGYEGARGMMYALSRSSLERGVEALLAAEAVPEEVPAWPTAAAGAEHCLRSSPGYSPIAAVCPACG